MKVVLLLVRLLLRIVKVLLELNLGISAHRCSQVPGVVVYGSRGMKLATHTHTHTPEHPDL